MPAIISDLKTPLIQVEKSEIFLDCLYPPIPRNIFDSALKYPEIHQFIRPLEERKDVRNKVSSGGFLPHYEERGSALKNLFRRLNSEGLIEFVELQLNEVIFNETKGPIANVLNLTTLSRC